MKGSGVSLYFSDATSYVQVNGGATLELSAPTSGAYQNLLIFEPDGLPVSAYTLNAGQTHKLEGMIYQPSRNVTINGQARLASTSATVVVNQLPLDDISWSVGAGAVDIAAADASGAGRLRTRLVD